MTTPENPTPENPTPDQPTPEQSAPEHRNPENPGGARSEGDEAAAADPREALEGLGGQPRIDEEGYPTAYTAVPPPLNQQQPQPEQPPSEQPGQPGQPSPQPYPQQPQQPYAQQSPQQPAGQADWGSPSGAANGRQQPASPPNQGAYAAAAQQPGEQGGQGRPGAGPGEPGTWQPGSGQPQPGAYPGDPQQGGPQQGYAYPPPPPGYEQYGTQRGRGTVPGMPPYASWGQRVGAWLIDNFVAVVGISILDASYYNWSYGIRAFSWVLMVVGVIWAIYNAYLAGQTGQSTGKRVLGIRLARYVDGQVVGPAFGILRLFMNAVFWAICVIPGILNYLWPLWDAKSQTWSDKIASSVVVRAR